jgi:uncharacterized membrane protein AbrB (regulator of aidB expression)
MKLEESPATTILAILGAVVIIGLIAYVTREHNGWLVSIAAVVIGIELGRFLRHKGYIK